jgi:hypothetical protein
MITAAITRTGLRRAVATIGLCVLSAATVRAQAIDPVMEWNDIARQLSVVPALSAVEQTRAMAIVHVSVHDAVNGVTGRYEHYRPAAEQSQQRTVGTGNGRCLR